MGTITVKEAKEKEIFVIVQTDIEYSNYMVGKKQFSRISKCNFKIEKTNLYSHVMESCDETTTPRGVAPRLHSRYNEETNQWELWSWGISGNNPVNYNVSFDTEEEIENELFRLVYEFDFVDDDQRDTMFFETEEEAEAELKSR
jgi:hypothetical protein